MLWLKCILPPLIPDCYVLCTPAIFKNIRNPLIFLQKMASYSCFWRVPSSKILLQASLQRILDLFTLVSLYCLKLKLSSDKINQKICCFLNTKYTAVNHDIFMLRVRWKEAGIMHVIVISCLIY